MSKDTPFSTSRRNVLMGAAAVAGMASAGVSFAASGHQHHTANTGLIDASLNCVKTGQACLSHCMSEFRDGNSDLVDCASAVQEMLTMCNTMSHMTSLESKHLKKVAQACIDVCDSCISECEKHAKKHSACKDCMNACKDCVKEMKKVA